jgi:hypothetical protein
LQKQYQMVSELRFESDISFVKGAVYAIEPSKS